jgi:diguanylate cyclase (GGDEF)-like protein/PAS domain S-box-containing protein
MDGSLHQDLLEHLSEGVYFVDRDRRIRYWNRAAESMTGYRKSDVIGTCCADNLLRHVDVEGRNMCQGDCPLSRAIQTGEKQDAEAFLRHRDGHRCPVRVKAVPVRDAEGAVTGAVEVFSDNSEKLELLAQVRELRDQALLDPLTGIGNRRLAQRTLEAKLERRARFGWDVALLLLDIDRFKRINDEHGHEAGDRALQLVAENLKRNSRSFDLPARWGGDEFVVILDNVALPQLRAIAERYRAMVETSSTGPHAHEGDLTISGGGTVARQGDTVSALLRRADRYLFDCKNQGRNRVRCE